MAQIKNAGKYAVKITSNTCITISDSFNVTEKQLTKCGFSYLLSKDTFKFTNNSLGSSTVKWFFGDGDSSIVSNPIHVFKGGHNYTIKLIDYGPCDHDTSSMIVQTEGTENIGGLKKITLFPNLATQTITLVSNEILPSSYIDITDITGRLFLLKLTQVQISR